MPSEFSISIVRRDEADSRPIRLRPGGTRERQLVAEIGRSVSQNLEQLVVALIPHLVDQIVAKGVGVLRREAHVRAAISEVLRKELSLDTPAVSELVAQAIDQVIQRLKADIAPQ